MCGPGDKTVDEVIAVNVVKEQSLHTFMRSEKDVKTKKVIINISSVAGLAPMITAPVYSGTEHGVAGFSRSMAAAVKAANASVRINVPCPWYVNKSLMSFLNSEEQIGDFCHFKRMTEKALEKHGILETDNVAKAFLTLVTDKSKEGEVIFIDTDGVKTVPLLDVPAKSSQTASDSLASCLEI